LAAPYSEAALRQFICDRVTPESRPVGKR
jgi:hypothetical protein